MFKVTWLGQAGLLFENETVKIIVDPYLSDSCEALSPKNRRRVPINEDFLKIKPDIIICTHNHLDHLDPSTLSHYLDPYGQRISLLCTENGFNDARKLGGNTNPVMMHPGTEWSEKGVRISAVKAYHSETTAIGVIIDDGDKKYYVTGDTLYNKNIFPSLPSDIFAVFFPINGVGNNMNITDAARFAKECGARLAVPLHWGLFDSLDPTELNCTNKRIPEFYKEIDLTV